MGGYLQECWWLSVIIQGGDSRLHCLIFADFDVLIHASSVVYCSWDWGGDFCGYCEVIVWWYGWWGSWKGVCWDQCGVLSSAKDVDRLVDLRYLDPSNGCAEEVSDTKFDDSKEFIKDTAEILLKLEERKSKGKSCLVIRMPFYTCRYMWRVGFILCKIQLNDEVISWMLAVLVVLPSLRIAEGYLNTWGERQKADNARV